MWKYIADMTTISKMIYNHGKSMIQDRYNAMARVLKVRMLVHFIIGRLSMRYSPLSDSGIRSAAPYLFFIAVISFWNAGV